MTATPQQLPRFWGVLSDAHAQLARKIDAHEQGGQPVPCRVSALSSWWVSDDPDERAAAERDELAAKVERVRALHFGEYVEDEDRNRCFECGDDWPCPTIRALDEEPQP